MKSVIPQAFNRIDDTGESRSTSPRPSSTGDPHEQFPEHEVLASTPLSPKRLGIQSTDSEFRNSFSELWWMAPQINNQQQNSFCSIVVFKPVEPTTFDYSSNSLEENRLLS